MDIKALNPHYKMQQTSKAIEEAVKQCNLDFVGINTSFLLKFISVLTRGQVGDACIERFLQVPKSRTTLNSFLTRQSENQFRGPPLEPEENLTKEDVKTLLGIAAGRSTRTVFNILLPN